jgi:M6 family metalloprotease-like protein
MRIGKTLFLFLLPFAFAFSFDTPATVDTVPGAPWKTPTPVVGLFAKGRDFIKQPFKVGIILVEFADVKHKPAHTPLFYQTYYFADRTYRRTPSGGSSPGSVADYFAEQSHGTFKMAGKAFDWVGTAEPRSFFLGKKTSDKEARQKLLTGSMESIRKRDGEKALDGFDAFCFIYAGSMKGAHTGDLLWAHRSSLGNPRKSYQITSEVETINVSCHEFGHIIGLPDFYQKKDKDGNVTREGLGTWCTMASGSRGEKPRHLGCWCKMRLGWLTPKVIEPAESRRYMLRPIESHVQDCLVVEASDTEYYMLENRQKIGFDTPVTPGLYIVRVNVVKNSKGSVSYKLHLMGPQDKPDDTPTTKRPVVWPGTTNETFFGPGFAVKGIAVEGENVVFTLEKG